MRGEFLWTRNIETDSGRDERHISGHLKALYRSGNLLEHLAYKARAFAVGIERPKS